MIRCHTIRPPYHSANFHHHSLVYGLILSWHYVSLKNICYLWHLSLPVFPFIILTNQITAFYLSMSYNMKKIPIIVTLPASPNTTAFDLLFTCVLLCSLNFPTISLPSHSSPLHILQRLRYFSVIALSHRYISTSHSLCPFLHPAANFSRVSATCLTTLLAHQFTLHLTLSSERRRLTKAVNITSGLHNGEA